MLRYAIGNCVKTTRYIKPFLFEIHTDTCNGFMHEFLKAKAFFASINFGAGIHRYCASVVFLLARLGKRHHWKADGLGVGITNLGSTPDSTVG